MQRALIFCIGLLFFSTIILRAQEVDTSEARFRAMEERMKNLEAQVQSLQTALAAASAASSAQAITAPAPAAEVPAPPAAPAALAQTPSSLPVYGGASSASKALNPDISVIGNFSGGAGRNPLNPFPALSLRESEFGFQAIVDPYARADFFVSIGDHGAEVEEGYITFPALPGGFQLKAGQMRANFGKLNALHNHVLPWLDRPLLTTNLLGGEPDESDAGIKDAGLSLSRLLPAPGSLFLEATGEVYRGESGLLFQSSRHSDLTAIGRLRSYADLGESTNVEVGGSYARGYNDVNSSEVPRFVCPNAFSLSPECTARDLFGRDFTTQLYGVDAMLRWKPLRRAIYHSFTARTEFVWSRRQEMDGTLRAHGFFASAEYQLGRRWFTGGRFDWSQRGRDPNMHDSSESLVLTYWPSEFSQVRGQLRRTNYAEGIVANEILFQFQFSIGAHGAHPF